METEKAKQPYMVPATNRDISIVYEDADFIVINKTAGIITHPKNENDETPSVAGWVLENYPFIKGVGEYTDRPGIMHRLDKDTSGILVIAKNQKTYDYFKKLFQERLIQKHYLALVIGRPPHEHGTVNSPIGRIGLKRTTVARHGKLKDKKEAVTEYKVVRKYERFTLLDVAPKTGRTHQIRVHMQHIGCPIAGDIIYAPKSSPRPPGLARLFLHASRLEFTAPDGKALTLEADMPDSLQKPLSALD